MKQLIKSAQAGTFESSDVLILVEPVPEGTGREIELESLVAIQFEESIRTDIHTVLDRFELEDVRMIVKDKGALSYCLIARTETAIIRAMGIEKGILPKEALL